MNQQTGARGLCTSDNWTCGVFIQTPAHVVVVSEDLNISPIYKKITGGRRRPQDNTKEDTAVREVHEETGIHITPEDLILVEAQPRRDHIYYLYRVSLPEHRITQRFERGKAGEIVHVLTHAELRAQHDQFLPHHFKMLVNHNLWPK